MDELKLSLKITLANTFLMYFKTQSYHWNVEGMFFPLFHDFFGELYQEVYGAVDPLAEEIRALDDYAPMSLDELHSTATVKEDVVRPVLIRDMLENLQQANQEVLDSLNKVFDLATAEKEQGLADFAGSRIDAHKKHAWMIRSSLKKIEE
jgi:starvation-inducible DNA-binding protein